MDLLGVYECNLINAEGKKVTYYKALIGERKEGGGYSIELVKATRKLYERYLEDPPTYDIDLYFDRFGRAYGLITE